MEGIQTTTDLLNGLNGGSTPTLNMLYTLTLVALLPSIVIMMTSFVRIIIILSFTRSALGVQQTPPNIVLAGISLFLTLFIMSPTIAKVNETAYQPYQRGEITQEEAIERMQVPMKEFMLKNTEKKTLNKFVEMSGTEKLDDPTQYPLTVVTPAFMTSELKRGFMAGFLLYLPFLLIDIVVATTLMSMGMAMMPPTMVSMPFKLLLFVSVNGWDLLFSTIISSFHT
ncbi:MAG: flagellar type III secretion system pore protein FliP [Eubacterium sp.]|nr:flagellar type III secretion system pore protein FliP [Eubacterium sp.]